MNSVADKSLIELKVRVPPPIFLTPNISPDSSVVLINCGPATHSVGFSSSNSGSSS